MLKIFGIKISLLTYLLKILFNNACHTQHICNKFVLFNTRGTESLQPILR